MSRPAPNFVSSPQVNLLRVLTIVVTLASCIALAMSYSGMPDTIPTHYGLFGTADSWGPKSSILWLPVFFVPLVIGVLWLSFYPQWFNYAFAITEANAQDMYRLGQLMISWIMFLASVIAAALILTPIVTVDLWWIIWASTAGIIVVVIWSLVAMRRLRSAA